MFEAKASATRFRATASVVGGLYLAGFVLGLLGTMLSARGDLASISVRSMSISIGAILWLLASMGDFAHGVLMFPILNLHSPRIALAYLGARVIQACLILFSTLFILLQVSLTKDYANAGLADALHIRVISDLCLSAQTYAYHIGMVVLAIAGMLLCYSALKTLLLARWMAIWGLIGYLLFFIGSVLEILQFDLRLLHTLVGGLWEVGIGLYLIFYGFNKLPLDCVNTP